MKKIAGKLICIALALGFTGCNWQIPEKVSVKTDAEYNFSLGSFSQDFSESLNISQMLGDLELPNNGKVYDYWPNKKGDAQNFLMYMPIQEIPIDISSYFDSGALADQIKNISFEKEIEVPEVSFSFPFQFALDKVNEEINKQFLLAGMISNYDASQFSSMLRQIAESISYSKGTLVVKAYNVDASLLTSLNAGSASIQNSVSDSDIDRYYSYGTVTITSGGKSISGTFFNGVAELTVPETGFEFKADDINISFSNEPFLPHVFIAKMDTSRDYQIKSISGIGAAITIPAVDINEEIDALQSLKDSGVEECKIGEGDINIDFDIPEEWQNVGITYVLSMSGGINITAAEYSASSGSTDNTARISLNGKSISAEKITVNAAFALSIAGATIDFTKPLAIGFDSSISRIDTVTVKLSDTSLSFAETQTLPEEVLAILKQIELGQCGIKGTYTNTLPEGNEVTLNISSDFFGLSNKQQTIAGGKNNEPFALLTSEEIRTINLTSENPAPAGKYNAFDFNVGVSLPGGEANKVTVKNVSPGQTYKLAVNVEPVINWESVTIDTSSLPSQSASIGTGFNPSTIFDSINGVLGEGFADQIELPDCKLYLYITVPELDALKGMDFSSTSISMFYGKNNSSSQEIEPIEGAPVMDIINHGKYKLADGELKELSFATAAPSLTVEKLDGKNEVVTSTINASDASFGLSISDLLKTTASTNVEDAQLCVSYDINFSVEEGKSGLRISKADFETATANSNIGSIGIYAVIELPLQFTVKGGTDIDLLSLINQNGATNSGDLFGRSSADALEQLKPYTDVIQSAKIDYKINSFPVVTSEDIQIRLDLSDDDGVGYKMPKLDGDGKVIDSIKINTSSGTEDSFVINSDDIENILNAYPLKLREAKISFAKDNTITIPRDKKIDVNLQIGITTSGKIPLFESNK